MAVMLRQLQRANALAAALTRFARRSKAIGESKDEFLAIPAQSKFATAT